MQETYRVELDAFEGPLDLLLYLIRRAEVDIHDIPMARVADGFMAALETADLASVDIDHAGEFLVMAATLMEIKSRVLARESEERPAVSDADAPPGADEDPRADLVRQLLEYKRYRDAADELDRRRGDWSRMAPLSPAGIDGGPLDEALDRMREEVEIDELDLGALVDAYQRIAATVNFDRLGEHEVVADETPIEVYAEEIIGRLRAAPLALSSGAEASRAGGLTLEQVLRGKGKRQMLGIFLAVLDLMKDQRLVVKAEGASVRLFERAASE